MRGSFSLYGKPFSVLNKGQSVRKGRNEELQKNRNELLIARYVFYATVTPKLQYDFIIGRLSEEFFLSPITIPKILSENMEAVSKLRKDTYSIRDFSKKWPHFDWRQERLLKFE